MKYRPMIPRAVMAAMILTMLVGCEGGCAGKANVDAQNATFEAVKPRLEQFAVQHPERKADVDEALASYTPGTGDVTTERSFADKAIPMLRQFASENPASADSINDMIRRWESRITKFTPPPK